MNEQDFDILILGGGPIGASAAYHLAERGAKSVGLLTEDPAGQRTATYMYAGGCVRWLWDDELKAKMTKETADFILKLDTEGVDLLLNKDHYFFMDTGAYVPSLNLSGAKLVAWLLGKAAEKGVEVRSGETILSIGRADGMSTIKTNKGEYRAKKVLLALGAANADLLEDYELEKELRRLYVLDLPVTDEQREFPHTIVPVTGGEAYVFVKHTADGWRFVVGEEDVLDPGSDPTPLDFNKLLDAGLGTVMPFLAKAKVEKVLWGIDTQKKVPRLEDKGDGLMVANCGSAVRSCAYIGRTCADALLS